MADSFYTAPLAWREIDPYDCRFLPNGGGCYAVYGEGGIIYIGQSSNLKVRLLSYRMRPDYGDGYITPWGNFSGFKLKIKPSRRYGDWAMRELRLIRRLRPRFNRAGVN